MTEYNRGPFIRPLKQLPTTLDVQKSPRKRPYSESRSDRIRQQRILPYSWTRCLILCLVTVSVPANTLFCHAWTRCVPTCHRHNRRLHTSETRLHVSYSTKPNNFAPQANDGNGESRSKRQRSSNRKSNPNVARRRNQMQCNRKKGNLGHASDNRHSTSPNNTVRSKQKAKQQSNQAAYEFNKWLQTVLEQQPTWDQVKQAQDLLLARVRQFDKSSTRNEDLPFDTISFNIVLQALARRHSVESAHAADNLLRVLWQETNLRADSYSYSAVLHAYAKSGGGRTAALRATELLQDFVQLSMLTDAPKHKSPRTDICHNAVIDAWAVSGDALAGHRAEQILRQLQQDPRRSATRVSFNAVIKAYARCGQPEEAQRILDEMRDLAQFDSSVKPDKVSLSTCIHAWAKSTKDFHLAACSADALLCEMEQAFNETGDESLRPDIVAYSSVLSAMAKSPAGSSSKALELLDRMKRSGKESPNAAFLNTWIHLLSKTNETQTAVSSAEAILEYMKRESTERNTKLRPCKVTYTAVITVLARAARSKDAAVRAEELLEELISLWETTGDYQYLPSAKTFASVLNALSKCGLDNGIERAEYLLGRMERLFEKTKSDELKPNVIVYLQVFQILARSRNPESGIKAKEILQEMNRLYLAGFKEVRPDATTMAYFLNTLTKAGVENAVEIATHVVNEVEEGYKAGIGHLKPTSLLYSACLQAYAKSSSAEGARLAESLLDRTKKLYQEGKMYAKPTVLFYNAVIDAHARSSGGVTAAERAEALLDEMESKSRAGDFTLRPNTRTFNAAILAWRNSNTTDAPLRAEALLKRMNEKYKAGDQQCRPDRVTLNTIIDVWAKSSQPQAPERAAEFLKFMESLYRKGDRSFRPDEYTFNSCIDAYGRRGDGPGAQSLFERMQVLARTDPLLQPGIITLTALQGAWNRSPQTRESLEHLATIQSMIVEQNRASRKNVLDSEEQIAQLSALDALSGKDVLE